MNIYYDKDSHPQFLAGKRIAIIGYGSQGHAHANNLKDSGHDVIVGLRPESRSWDKAKTAGLKVAGTSEAALAADIVMMLVPDEIAPEVYRQEIAPHLRPGQYLAFAHGFSVHFGKIVPPKEVNVKAKPPERTRVTQAEADADDRMRKWKRSLEGRALGLFGEVLSKVVGGYLAIVGMGLGIVMLRHGVRVDPQRTQR